MLSSYQRCAGLILKNLKQEPNRPQGPSRQNFIHHCEIIILQAFLYQFYLNQVKQKFWSCVNSSPSLLLELCVSFLLPLISAEPCLTNIVWNSEEEGLCHRGRGSKHRGSHHRAVQTYEDYLAESGNCSL